MNDQKKQKRIPKATRSRTAETPIAGGEQRPNAKTLISRRGFLYGAAGVGALAAIGIGATVARSLPDSGDSSVAHLNAPDSALTTLNEFEAIEDP